MSKYSLSIRCIGKVEDMSKELSDKLIQISLDDTVYLKELLRKIKGYSDIETMDYLFIYKKNIENGEYISLDNSTDDLNSFFGVYGLPWNWKKLFKITVNKDTNKGEN